MELKATQMSSAITYGDIDLEWIEGVAPAIGSFVRKGAVRLRKLAEDMWAGGKELFGAIMRRDWSLFESFIAENPFAAGAGIVATGLAGALLVSPIGAAIGILKTGLGVVVKGLRSMGVLGGITIGVGLPSLISGLVRGTQQLYRFNWNQTDTEIEGEIKSAIASLYGQAGDSLGTALAGILVGGGGNPKVEIGMKSLCALWETIEEDIRDEVLESLSTLVFAGVRTAGLILFKKTYMSARKLIRSNFRTGIPAIDKAIAAWGLNGTKPWSIAYQIEEKIEEIPDENIRNFVEEFVDSFFTDVGQFLLLRYDK